MELKIEHLAPYLPYQPTLSCGKIAEFKLEYPMLGIRPDAVFTYLNGIDDTLAVSRRQLSAVREAIAN